MTDPTELARVLAALDETVRCDQGDNTARIAEDAARLLREMAADFDEYADHGLDDRGNNCDWLPPGAKGDCSCGLDAARERWRVKP